MQVSNQPCEGLFGSLFGHNFKPQYDTTSTPTQLNDKSELLKRADLPDLLSSARNESYSGDEVDAMSAILDSEVHYATTKTYRGSICLRCGLTVTSPTFSLTKPTE